MTSDNPACGAMQILLFGTTAGWKSSLTRYCGQLGRQWGREADWEALAAEWRSLYAPAIAPVREGQRGWSGFEKLHRETLDALLPNYNLDTLSVAPQRTLSRPPTIPLSRATSWILPGSWQRAFRN